MKKSPPSRPVGIVVILNQDIATTDLPCGFDLLYQTCQNGQFSSMSMSMSMMAPTKVV